MHRLKFLAIVLALIATFIPCFAASFVVLDRAYKREADESSSSYMPVLVLTSGNIEVMANSEVETFVQAHPDATFLIPEGEIEALNLQLQASHRDDVSRSFTVEQLSPNRQYVHVECRAEGAWAGWYEATDKAIVPRFSKIYGSGFVFLVVPLAGILTGAVWFVAIGCWRAVRWRPGKPHPH